MYCKRFFKYNIAGAEFFLRIGGTENLKRDLMKISLSLSMNCSTSITTFMKLPIEELLEWHELMVEVSKK